MRFGFWMKKVSDDMTRLEEIEMHCRQYDTRYLKEIADSLKIIAECMQEKREKEEQAERYGFMSNECRRGI